MKNRLPAALALAVAFLAVMLLVAAPAFADTRIDAAPILAAWRPILGDIAAAIVTGLVGWAAMMLKQRLGIEVERGHRDAFQVALGNAAGLVLDRMTTAGAGLDVRNQFLADGVEYVLARVPDAIRHFGITDERIREGIEAKLGLIVEPKPPRA